MNWECFKKLKVCLDCRPDVCRCRCYSDVRNSWHPHQLGMKWSFFRTWTKNNRKLSCVHVRAQPIHTIWRRIMKLRDLNMCLCSCSHAWENIDLAVLAFLISMMSKVFCVCVCVCVCLCTIKPKRHLLSRYVDLRVFSLLFTTYVFFLQFFSVCYKLNMHLLSQWLKAIVGFYNLMVQTDWSWNESHFLSFLFLQTTSNFWRNQFSR